ncbi:hypothetical protein G2W53_025614 [Senna tora]|uniref:Uncharacterized protein n=1 Tax=Senna tora TaxID=362788 RepID=A0A834WKF5_9FABA|nr:hypothetical protein G2W53_025614 [Senna tora]
MCVDCIIILKETRPAAKTVRTGSGGILMVGAIRPINPILKPKEDDDDDVANYTYMKVKPHPHDDDDDEKKKGHDENIRGGGGSSSIVEACLPKGFKPSSAPSRYINYQPLGSSSSCFSGKVGNAP